jgi:hypothetical protein
MDEQKKTNEHQSTNITHTIRTYVVPEADESIKNPEKCLSHFNTI